MPSLGKDFAAIRAHLDLSIQDVHHATKIPINTLQSIENGVIFEQTEEITTYVRSFVRSYGRALRLDDGLVVEALNQNEAGTYNHLLLESFPELYDKIAAPTENKKKKKSEKALPDSNNDHSDPKFELDTDALATPGAAEKVISQSNPGKPLSPATKQQDPVTQKFKPVPDPGVRSVDWANMGKKFYKEPAGIPVWLIGIFVILIILLTAVYILFRNDFIFSNQSLTEADTTSQQIVTGRPSAEYASPLLTDISVERDSQENEREEPDETEQSLSPPSDVLPRASTDQDHADAIEQVSSPVLDDTLHLTVFAAKDHLNPLQVWSDLRPRMSAYWMDHGTAYHFEFKNIIRIRGPYDAMLLFLNGHQIPEFYQDHFDTDQHVVELTRSIFDDDEKWAVEIPLELPEGVSTPELITYRPRF